MIVQSLQTAIRIAGRGLYSVYVDGYAGGNMGGFKSQYDVV